VNPPNPPSPLRGREGVRVNILLGAFPERTISNKKTKATVPIIQMINPAITQKSPVAISHPCLLAGRRWSDRLSESFLVNN
jgi:hypothetical protein